MMSKMTELSMFAGESIKVDEALIQLVVRLYLK